MDYHDESDPQVAGESEASEDGEHRGEEPEETDQWLRANLEGGNNECFHHRHHTPINCVECTWKDDILVDERMNAFNRKIDQQVIIIIVIIIIDIIIIIIMTIPSPTSRMQ